MDYDTIAARLDALQASGLAAVAAAASLPDLEAVGVAYLGRKGELKELLGGIGQLPGPDRPRVGAIGNRVREALEGAVAARHVELEAVALEERLAREALDVTLPGRRLSRGSLHPVIETNREIARIFGEFGFVVYEGPEVETDERNFQALNIPPDHPARDLWDTLYTNVPGHLLRTHTSPGQIHVMREYAPEPVRVILPGMCYRYEQASARKDIQFNQVEGLAIGTGITFGDLKGTLVDFARRMFDDSVRTRFRASYFPFTEPSAEMDIECFLCGGKGCGVCSQSGWLEILGSGMVHPTVLKNGGYDPEKFTGFAFGMGPERVAMLKYRIEDIRYIWANDVRFLEQF